MKKGIFILLALAISSTVLKAQRTPYIPVLTDSVYWLDIMRGEDGGLGLGFDSVYQTTVYNDTIYYNMYQGPWLVEDTTSRRIYSMSSSNLSIANRYLMYDFSLEEGDSIFMDDYVNYKHWFYVDSIRQISTLDGLRKVWYLHFDYDQEDTEYPIWVEGIGSLAGLDRYNMQPRLDWWGWGILNCWYSGEKLIYKSDFAEQYGCRLELIDIEQLETFNLKLFPNPANNSVFFEFDNGYCKKTKIEIFNFLGEKIFQTEICDNNYQLNTASFSNGMYVYVITENEKIRFANKFIVKH